MTVISTLYSLIPRNEQETDTKTWHNQTKRRRNNGAVCALTTTATTTTTSSHSPPSAAAQPSAHTPASAQSTPTPSTVEVSSTAAALAAATSAATETHTTATTTSTTTTATTTTTSITTQIQLPQRARRQIRFKCGMMGDAGVGKTSLMVQYLEGVWNPDYVETLGVNFMEKKITLAHSEVNISVWDLGGSDTYLHMMPLVVNDASMLLFMFDLTRPATLASIRTQWFPQARTLNKAAKCMLVGTKYDQFVTLPAAAQRAITDRAIQYADRMKAPLVFCSSAQRINIRDLFKIALARVFDLKNMGKVQQSLTYGQPIVRFYPPRPVTTPATATAPVAVAGNVNANVHVNTGTNTAASATTTTPTAASTRTAATDAQPVAAAVATAEPDGGTGDATATTLEPDG